MYEKITLDNGVRIVSEKMPQVRSAAVGIWVGTGSRYEKSSENGSAHFIEHMLFKGTQRHTASELAEVFDGIGGQINAFTTRESTCFYARVLDSHLDTAINLLSDMFFESKFRQEDIDNERGVILEEIDMYDDSPEDLVAERLLAKSFRGALGRPVLGKPRALEAADRDSLLGFMAANYSAPRTVIALCGSFTDDHLRLIGDRFSRMQKTRAVKPQKSAYVQSFTTKRKPTEQNHLCAAFPGLTSSDPERFAFQLMSNILGGGMSSRLFQTIREKHGLCYSVYAFTASFSDTGLFGVQAATGGETEERALRLIMDELRLIIDGGVTDDELHRAREQAKSNIVMTLESTSSRMNKLGSGELFLGGSLTADELIEKYDAVTREDILNVTRRLLRFDEMSFSAVGRVGSEDKYRELLTARI